MEKQRRIVYSVDKAFTLLETMLANKKPVSIKELAADTGFPKSTIHDLLSTMRLRGIVEQNQFGDYILGYRLWEYGLSAYMSWDDVQRANPILCELATQTKTNSLLAVDTYGALVNVGYWCSKEDIGGIVPFLGKKYPFHATAMGKVFLAHYDESRVDRYIKSKEFKKYTPNTITDAECLKKELKIIKETGFAVCSGEFHEQNKCIAVPVYGKNKEVIYTLGVLDNINGLNEESIKDIVRVLKKEAGKVSKLFG